MTKEDDTQIPDRERRFMDSPKKRIFAGALLTILLGAIGSGIWDIIFRPSLNRAGSLVTRLSQHADNAVFTTAALNPLPLPSLIILMLIIFIPLVFAINHMMDAFFKFRFEDALDKWHKEKLHATGKQEMKRKLRLLYRVLHFFQGIIMISIFLASFAGFQIVNEAILVWRVFHQNLAICVPVVSAEQQTTLQSQFVVMKTRKDFKKIVNTLDQKAKEGNLQLEWYKKKS